MSAEPYGEHAERIAVALAELIRGPVLPDNRALWPVILTSRDIVLGGLTDRLWNQFRVQVKITDPAAQSPVKFDVLQRAPVTELAYVVTRLPRMNPDQRLPPAEALADVDDPVARSWITTATGVLVSNHVLNTADTKPWRTHAPAHAALASDTAQIVEAVAVLDEHLAAAGALDDHNTQVGPTAQTTTARLVASCVDRLAQWVSDHPAIDVAVSPPNTPPEFEQPVLLVNAPADLLAAQRALEVYLRPMADRDLQSPHHLSAATALTVAHNQVNLLASLHTRIMASPDVHDQLPRLERLQDQLESVLYATRGLHDPAGPRVHALIRGQQQEISVAVKNGGINELTSDQIRELVTTTQTMLGTWATALGRELGRESTDLRVARRGRIDQPVYGRAAQGGPAMRALTVLAKYHQVTVDPPHDPSRNARAQLRQTLAQTPPSDLVAAWPRPGRRHETRRPPTTQAQQTPRRPSR